MDVLVAILYAEYVHVYRDFDGFLRGRIFLLGSFVSRQGLQPLVKVVLGVVLINGIIDLMQSLQEVGHDRSLFGCEHKNELRKSWLGW